MSLTVLCFVVASSLYTGFQWTIRVVVYPQFNNVPPADFVAYEQSHQQRVAVAVGPLFAALVLCSAAMLVRPPQQGQPWVPILLAVLVALLLGVTAFSAVPLHRRLSTGFDVDAHRRLLQVDAVRLLIAVAATGLSIWLLAQE